MANTYASLKSRSWTCRPVRFACDGYAVTFVRANKDEIFFIRALSLDSIFLSIERMPGVSHRSSPNGAVGIRQPSTFNDTGFILI